MPERNYVGEIILECFLGSGHIRLKIDEVGSTNLTMDQAQSLGSILKDWVEKYQEQELKRYDHPRS